MTNYEFGMTNYELDIAKVGKLVNERKDNEYSLSIRKAVAS